MIGSVQTSLLLPSSCMYRNPETWDSIILQNPGDYLSNEMTPHSRKKQMFNQPISEKRLTLKYTGCPRRNGPNFGRVFLMLNSTDITLNTYIQSWTVTEIMAIEKCWLLWCPRTVSCPWRHIHPLRKPGNEKPLSNIGMQWRWRDNSQLLPASITWKPKANAKVVRVFL